MIIPDLVRFCPNYILYPAGSEARTLLSLSSPQQMTEPRGDTAAYGVCMYPRTPASSVNVCRMKGEGHIVRSGSRSHIKSSYTRFVST